MRLAARAEQEVESARLPLIASLRRWSAKQVKGELELWSMIFEKAWAKLHQSYEATSTGETADTNNYLSAGTVQFMYLEPDASKPASDKQWEVHICFVRS